ncbi:MAG: 23S rRNA (adenine(2503)-C(2))-methyltransferase RlmN, partial [Parvibaculaceae bacterium]
MTAVTLDIGRSLACAPVSAGPAKLPLVGLTRAELTEALALAGIPEKQRRMRMRQIWSWVYQRGVTSIAQ